MIKSILSVVTLAPELSAVLLLSLVALTTHTHVRTFYMKANKKAMIVGTTSEQVSTA